MKDAVRAVQFSPSVFRVQISMIEFNHESSIRVVLVEDHALTREGMRTALTRANMQVVGESGDGIAAESMIITLEPQVAIVDLGLPGQDGVALTRNVKAMNPNISVVIVTMQESEEYVFAALSAGANAFCVKASDSSIMLDAVRTVAAGGAYFDPKIAHLILHRLNYDARKPVSTNVLTKRELDVLRLVAEGLGNQEISAQLFLGVGTVKAHIHDILEKLSASDRAQAAIIAFRKGWIR
jgi:NarL family two-component system response regulator LiaR